MNVVPAAGVGVGAAAVVGGLNYAAWNADRDLRERHGTSPGLGFMAFLPSMALGTIAATGGLLGHAAGDARVALLLPAGLGMVGGAIGGAALGTRAVSFS